MVERIPVTKQTALAFKEALGHLNHLQITHSIKNARALNPHNLSFPKPPVIAEYPHAFQIVTDERGQENFFIQYTVLKETCLLALRLDEFQPLIDLLRNEINLIIQALSLVHDSETLLTALTTLYSALLDVITYLNAPELQNSSSRLFNRELHDLLEELTLTQLRTSSLASPD